MRFVFTEKELKKIITKYIEVDSDANSTIKKQAKYDLKSIYYYVQDEFDFQGLDCNIENVNIIMNDLLFLNEYETYDDKLKDYK